MIALGILLAALSGLANGLFTVPMKVIPRWKWEHIWLVFIVAACIAMPLVMVLATTPHLGSILIYAPRAAVAAALVFGFCWGFGAILFGLSVDRLGVSIANSLVIGLSSAAGSVVPLILQRRFSLNAQQLVLLGGVAAFLAGVALCGQAGRLRDGAKRSASWTGYLFAAGAGVISAIFNIGYALALPIVDVGTQMGASRFGATNCIWLLMLGAGSIPNIAFCAALISRHGNARLLMDPVPRQTWGLSILMALLWGGSIFLYGAATPLLGAIGPSIGWPLSLAVGLVVANTMGFWLGEWRTAAPAAVGRLRAGIAVLLVAVVLCAISSRMAG